MEKVFFQTIQMFYNTPQHKEKVLILMKVNDFLLNLSREIDIHHFVWTTLAKDMHQWNIVTNKNGGNATALDAEKTQFMLGNIGNDTLIGGNKNDVIIGRNGDDYLYGGMGSDRLYGGDGLKLLTSF